MLNDECEKALKEEKKKHEVNISSYAFRLGWDAALENVTERLIRSKSELEK